MCLRLLIFLIIIINIYTFVTKQMTKTTKTIDKDHIKEELLDLVPLPHEPQKKNSDNFLNFEFL